MGLEDIAQSIDTPELDANDEEQKLSEAELQNNASNEDDDVFDAARPMVHSNINEA